MIRVLLVAAAIDAAAVGMAPVAAASGPYKSRIRTAPRPIKTGGGIFHGVIRIIGLVETATATASPASPEREQPR
jgi:hypothetical protein